MKRDPASLAFTALAVVSLIAGAFPGGLQPGAAPASGTRERRRRGTPPASDTRAGSGAGSGFGAGAGHDAETPAEIPARGWWAISKRVASDISGHRLLTEAAGITFFTLLALFPALAALVSIYGLFADPASIAKNLDALSGVVPEGGMSIISDQAHSLAEKGGTALGFGALVGLGTSLWSANQGTKALFDALNIVYDEEEKRGFVLRTAVTLAFTLGIILFVLLALAAVVAVPVALNFVGLGALGDLLLRLLRWPLLLAALAVLLACIYRFGPSRERARWHWVTWGGGVAAVLWVLVSIGFSYYVSHFGTYNKTYGSLGAVVGFMTWLWLSATIVLIGAAVTPEMEHQTARDTTTGPETAPGRRGATKADQVAPA